MDATAKAWSIVDSNTNLIREVIDSARCVAADLSGNADDRVRGGYVLIEEARVRQLLRAVEALDCISLPT